MTAFYPVLQNLIQPGFVSGRTYQLTNTYTITSGPTAVDTIYMVPFILLYPLTFTNGKMFVNTAGASSAVKAAIWANSPVSNRPLGAPLFTDDTGVATTSSSTTITIPIAGSLAPGLFWYGTKYKATLPVMNSMNSAHTYGTYIFGNASNTTHQAGLAYADVYTNNMPTIAEGATFSQSSTHLPLMALTVA